MTPMLVPAAPERESAPQGARKPANSGAAREAFDGEIRGAERRASGTAPQKDASPSVEPVDPAEEQAVAAREAPNAEADVAGLLAALGGVSNVGRAGSDTGSKQDAPTLERGRELDAKGHFKAALPGELSQAEETDLLSRGLAGTGGDGDLALGARARLKIAHQETHFEPTMREGVLVADEGAKAAPRPASDRDGLLQLLASSRTNGTGDARAARDKVFETPGLGTEEAGAAPVDESGSTNGRNVSGAEAGAPDARRWSDAARTRVGASPAQLQMEASAPRGDEPGLASSIDPGATTGAPGLSTQVAGRIVDAFSGIFSGETSLGRPEAPSTEAQLRLRAGGSVLKTLTIQLQPEHLGTLNVSMSLKDGQLTLEMAANRAETARLLTQDRGALRSILEKAGFSIDDAAIVVVNRDGPSLPASQTAHETADGANRDMARSGDPQTGGGREERGDEEPERRRPAVSAPLAAGRSTSGDSASRTVFL